MPIFSRIRSNRLRGALLLCLFPLALPAAARPAGEVPAGPRTASLTPVLAGEFSLQAGKLGDAAHWYLEAAREGEGDVGLAERATRIAMLADDEASASEALALWAQRDPGALAVRATRASLALRQGDTRLARRELLAVLRTDGAWRYAVLALATGGRDPAAPAKVLGDLVDAGAIPDDLEAWQEFGRLALRMERPELARRMVGEVVKRFPDEPRVALLHATQLNQSGNKDQALALLRGIEPKAATDEELRNALAFAYDALGEPGRAERTLATGEQDVQTWGMRASLLAKQKDDPALLALYRDIAAGAGKPDPDQRLLLGRIAEYLKRYREAVDWYHGVPGGPQRNEARLRAVNALHALGETAQADQEVRAIQGDVLVDDDVRRDAYLLEAELRQRDGHLEAETAVLTRGLAAYPDDGALLYARALAWERGDDIARAEADLRQILVAEPENVAALNALGYTLADRTSRYQEALELIDRARVAEPDNAAIIDSYGWVLYRLGRAQEALVHLRRAWSLNKDPEVAAHVGEVLWTLGRKDEARRFFDEARALDPDNRALQRALEALGA
ncbi:tetratricopeptide repeat protein [Stenotrophomonas mori]|uniref:Tetratricopeptide repeat protein n=1 Tax=Stenotrophomonas mori TaxID=2871096 RepID=A0ABT0SIN7_9GAMM|nr:tetratricopeptide repeat protein [Stenotrophomonas mori]MCL7715201.1 tetratricopeptide repeat protein [Stenotrophomonas mori]